MSLVRLDASIREDGPTSRALADLVEKHWQDTAPGAPVSRRHIGVNPLPRDAWATHSPRALLPTATVPNCNPRLSRWPAR